MICFLIQRHTIMVQTAPFISFNIIFLMILLNTKVREIFLIQEEENSDIYEQI